MLEQTYLVCTQSVGLPDLAISMSAHLTQRGNADHQCTSPTNHKVWRVTNWRWKGDKWKCVHFLLQPFCAQHWRGRLLHLFIHPSQDQAVLQMQWHKYVAEGLTQVRLFTHRAAFVWSVWGGCFRGWGTQLRGCGCCVVCLLFRA